MSEKDHIASLDGWVPAAFCMRQQSGADIFALSPIEEATVRLKYYRLYIVKNLRIDYKKRLTCFYELYGYYLEFSSAPS